MEKSYSQKILKDLFNYIDQDQDSLITFKEITPFFEQIQKDVSNTTLKDFFVIDGSDDEIKIGFEVFNVWFIKKINENNIPSESVLLSIQNYLKDKIKTHPEEEEKESYQNHYANITFEGEFLPKTEATLKMIVGEKVDKIFQECTKGIHVEKSCGIIFSIKTKNPTRAEESIKYFIPRFLAWLNEILPAKSTLDFKQMKEKTNIEGEMLKILFEPDNKGINEFIEQFNKVQSRVIPEGLEGKANLEVKLKKDFDAIFKEETDPANQLIPKKNILHHIFEGASLMLKGSLTESILNKLRNDYLKSKTFAKLPQGMKNMAFLLLWKSTKVEISFKRFRASFLEEVLPENLDLSFEKILNDLKEHLNPLQKKYTMLKTLFLIMNKEFIADFNVTIKVPGALVSLEVKTQGIKEIYDHISSQN